MSHRIAPGEFLPGGLFVQAPCLFSFTLLFVELCSGRPNSGATQSFGEKLCLLSRQRMMNGLCSRGELLPLGIAGSEALGPSVTLGFVPYTIVGLR